MRTIQAVIGVWVRDERAFYVRRSNEMENYPDVWGLLSIQFTNEQLPNPFDVEAVQRLMQRMSDERLCNTPIRTVGYITTAQSTDNPMHALVRLHLYEVELDEEPELNRRYYVEAAWFTPGEHKIANSLTICGLCTRTWAAWCERNKAQRSAMPRSIETVQ